jgi:hypothetical protein
MNRFFAFGCSYARYAYATWADFIGINFDNYYNYGRGGASNNYILSKFLEANLKHNFNSSDTVIVMFTGFGRISYIPKNKDGHLNWRTSGDLFEYYHNTKDKNIASFLENMYSDNWAIEFSWQAVHLIKQILTYQNVPHKLLMSIDNRHYLDNDGSKWGKSDIISDVSIEKTKSIYDLLDIKESLDEWKEKKYSIKDYILWQEENNRLDGHPTQKMHFEFIKEKLPEFISEKSIDVLNKVEDIFINDSQTKQSIRFSHEFQNNLLTT